MGGGGGGGMAPRLAKLMLDSELPLRDLKSIIELLVLGELLLRLDLVKLCFRSGLMDCRN